MAITIDNIFYKHSLYFFDIFSHGYKSIRANLFTERTALNAVNAA